MLVSSSITCYYSESKASNIFFRIKQKEKKTIIFHGKNRYYKVYDIYEYLNYDTDTYDTIKIEK